MCIRDSLRPLLGRQKRVEGDIDALGGGAETGLKLGHAGVAIAGLGAIGQ